MALWTMFQTTSSIWSLGTMTEPFGRVIYDVDVDDLICLSLKQIISAYTNVPTDTYNTFNDSKCASTRAVVTYPLSLPVSGRSDHRKQFANSPYIKHKLLSIGFVPFFILCSFSLFLFYFLQLQLQSLWTVFCNIFLLFKIPFPYRVLTYWTFAK